MLENLHEAHYRGVNRVVHQKGTGFLQMPATDCGHFEVGPVTEEPFDNAGSMFIPGVFSGDHKQIHRLSLR